MKSSDARSVVSNLHNPCSFYWMTEFPGCAALGLNPDIDYDAKVADAIIWALQAGENLDENGYNSASFGKLEAMIKYGIVKLTDIDNAVSKYYCSKVPANMPEHDAF